MIKNKKELELYFHIPFCVQKCSYCDFLSAPATKQTQQRYMEALLKETVGRSEEYAEYVVVSIFIGGGTPSVVEPEWIERLMETVYGCYQVAGEAEITMEANPGTVKAEQLQRYRKAGINRLSIGLQSALEEELKRLGRIHTYEQFLEAYYGAREAGFANINVDIMSALPGQTTEDYRKTLGAVLGLVPPPEHISAYSLIVEEGTPFWEADCRGELELPDEDSERQMYQETKELLEQKGYYRYEISNYAKEGLECRHNCGYWRRISYAGFGIGAASLVDNTRFSNIGDLEAYCTNPLGARAAVTALTREEQIEEFMFLGLRMTKGISRSSFMQIFGIEPEEMYGDVLERNYADGLLVQEGDFIRLTDRGLDVSNYVSAQFLLD